MLLSYFFAFCAKLSRVVSAVWVSALSAFLLSAIARADPEALGFSSERLTRLDAAIQREINEHRLAGGIVYLTRHGEPVHIKAYGQQDIEAQKPMTLDTIFRLASMTKAITSVAVMMLYEEGHLLLNDPLAKYLPAFKNPVVAVPPSADAPPGTKFTTVPAKNPLTIRHLLTHTAGLTYGDGLAGELYEKANLVGWYFAHHDETIGEAVNRLATLPLHSHPGESYQYGFSTDVLGHLIEVVSGQPLDRFFEERIFKPLQMRDTSFFVPLEKVERLASVYGLESGKLVLKESAEKSDYVRGPRKCFSGGAGLLSTAGDYGRFLQMLLNEGELDGVRLLSPGAVRLMRQNHVGNKYRGSTAGYGLGFWINDDPGFYGELVGPGAYGWGSAYFPEYFIDPENGLVAMILAQLIPSGPSNLDQRFKVLVYQAFME